MPRPPVDNVRFQMSKQDMNRYNRRWLVLVCQVWVQSLVIYSLWELNIALTTVVAAQWFTIQSSCGAEQRFSAVALGAGHKDGKPPVGDTSLDLLDSGTNRRCLT